MVPFRNTKGSLTLQVPASTQNTAVVADRERFGTVIPAVDELARSLRLVEEFTVGETPGTLRIDPA